MKNAGLVAVFALTFSASLAHGEEQAKTSQLPQALSSLGVSQQQILTQSEASHVRGASGQLVSFLQLKQFVIADGAAAGTTTLLEGVFGQFEFNNGRDTVVAGTFGGLQGHIGSDADGNFHFYVAGKAFQESFEFVGAFAQQFQQTFQK